MEHWSIRIRRVCAGVLILAAMLRLGGSSPAAAAPGRESAAFLFYLATGRVPGPTVETAPTETAPPETQASRPFSLELDNIAIKYGTEARPDVGALLQMPGGPNLSGDAPRVLILHTHATESYTPAPGWEYEPSANYRSLDEEFNMVRVGARIAENLNRAGITTLHERGYCDYPSYNDSYNRALDVIEDYLERYPTIEMVIDVHRDAVENPDGSQMDTAFALGGRQTARLLLVMGSNEGGLYHPDWQVNLSWALKLQAAMEAMYPGLPRPLSLRPERYNEHATPASILLEVGTAGDTLESALNAADCFCEALTALADALNLR